MSCTYLNVNQTVSFNEFMFLGVLLLNYWIFVNLQLKLKKKLNPKQCWEVSILIELSIVSNKVKNKSFNPFSIFD